MMKDFIYADNAATTRISDSVLAEMLPYLKENYGNASSLYQIGRNSHQAIEKARKTVAELIGASPVEIFFTSGGSEADNWALKGVMRKSAASGKKHMITTAIEHHAVLHSAKALENEGFEVTYLPVDELGRVSAQDVKEAIRSDTALVSVMYANNEIGTIQPVREIGAVCKDAGVLFHTDAVQAAGILPIDVKADNIDMMAISAHKFHGPKGVGALYCKKGLFPEALVDGGAQERGHRAGTENVAGIIGMAKAFSEACAEMKEKAEKLSAMRDEVQEGLLKIHDSRLNGDPENRLPGNLNISFSGVDGQSLLFDLDLQGLAASSGSACASGSVDPSHVLMAIGIPYEMAHGSLRISLGKYNKKEEAGRIIKIVSEVVLRLRGEA
ncbi:MAG: cysteine desulfurase NifS [Firmicutes bacterium]|nr:cysteine desulfurase NifS [Bacillota bacterium]